MTSMDQQPRDIRILLHDLRTPLSTILLMSELIQTDLTLPEEVRNSLGSIITEVHRITLIADEIAEHPATQTMK